MLCKCWNFLSQVIQFTISYFFFLLTLSQCLGENLLEYKELQYLLVGRSGKEDMCMMSVHTKSFQLCLTVTPL